MAVKPILGMVPPDPIVARAGDLRGCSSSADTSGRSAREQFHALHKLMTMSSADYLDEWFEFDPLKATKSASGIIGTFLGPRSPGTAYVLLHHYMGEIDGAFRAWGFQKGGTGAISDAIASAARALGAEIRTDAPVRAGPDVKDGRATGVALDERRRARARRSSSRARSAAHLPAARRSEGSCPTISSTASATLQVPRLVGQGEPRAQRAARFHLPAGRRASRLRAARSRSARASSTSSAPTTTRSTASSRGSRTWTSSSRR